MCLVGEKCGKNGKFDGKNKLQNEKKQNKKWGLGGQGLTRWLKMTPEDSIVGGDELTCHTRRSAPSILWIYLTYASVEEPAESVLRGKGKSWRRDKPMCYIQVGEVNDAINPHFLASLCISSRCKGRPFGSGHLNDFRDQILCIDMSEWGTIPGQTQVRIEWPKE